MTGGNGLPAQRNGLPAQRYQLGNGVVNVLRDGDLTRIVIVGDLDMSTVARVRLVVESACQSKPANVVVDLSAVEFVDSHGLHLLVETQRRVTADGCALVVVPPPDAIRRVFELTGLDWLFGDEPAATAIGHRRPS
jgi:anti-sigma B factor antagonist